MKNRLSILLAAGLLSFSIACQTGDENAASAIDYQGFDSYGDASTHAATTKDVVTPVELVSRISDLQGKDVTVTGTVREVCQAAGCWLTLDTADGSDDQESTTIRISVPRDDDGNYVFTVPKDISGRSAYVTGYVEEQEVDQATLDHYAEDAARAAGESVEEMHGDEAAESDAAHDAPKVKEIRITAKGVSLEPAAAV